MGVKGAGSGNVVVSVVTSKRNVLAGTGNAKVDHLVRDKMMMMITMNK